jgi:hypothetical protein
LAPGRKQTKKVKGGSSSCIAKALKMKMKWMKNRLFCIAQKVVYIYETV